MIDRMLETGDLARAAIQMWSKDPSAEIVFGNTVDGKVRMRITVDVPVRSPPYLAIQKGEDSEL